MKIKFTDREEFEKAINNDFIFSANTRLNSAGDLVVEYAAMVCTFYDRNHGKRAVERLRKNGFTRFTVDESAIIGI